jgi:hypothetical protein
MQDVPQPTYFITADSWFARKAVSNRFWRKGGRKVLVMAKDHERWGRVREHAKQYDEVISPTRFHGEIVLPEEDGFCTGQNSGFCGLQLAVRLRATCIHLLGIDLTFNGGVHYHNRYGGPDKKRLDEFLVYFSQAVIILKRADIRVVSHSRVSRLNDVVDYENLEGQNNERRTPHCVALHSGHGL